MLCVVDDIGGGIGRGTAAPHLVGDWVGDSIRKRAWLCWSLPAVDDSCRRRGIRVCGVCGVCRNDVCRGEFHCRCDGVGAGGEASVRTVLLWVGGGAGGESDPLSSGILSAESSHCVIGRKAGSANGMRLPLRVIVPTIIFVAVSSLSGGRSSTRGGRDVNELCGLERYV